MPYIGKSPSQGVRSRYYYTVSVGATSVSGSDDNSNTLVFSDGNYCDVSLNGVTLVAGTDYNTTTANTIAGLSAMSANDVVEVVVYDTFSIFSGNINSDLSVGGNSTITGTLSSGAAAFSGDVTTTNNINIGNHASANLNFLRFGGTQNGAADIKPTDDGGHKVGLSFLTDNSADATVNTSEVMRISSAGDIGIGTSSPKRNFHLNNSASASTKIQITNGATGSASDGDGFQLGIGSDGTAGIEQRENVDLTFSTNNTERFRVLADGNIVVARTSNDLTAAGISLEAAGTGGFVRSGGPCLILNRLASDGEIIRLVQAGTTEGTISSSGSTISYNTFTGSHWSQLTDGSKPTILAGTVLETIDEMCVWYQAEYTIPEVKYLEGDSNIPEGKSVGDVKEEKINAKDSIALPSGKNVGDTFTHTVDDIDYTAKIIKEDDNKHVKCKISTTEESTSVYGVFMAWDEDDKTVNDMYVNAVGTTIVRIHKDQTISKGDLLVSNGDGTAKKQDDDIIRSKTIGKALTNIKQETYDDGSYTIPCALYCG